MELIKSLPSPDVICMGEALIDFLPAPATQSLKNANKLRRVAGGAPANLAVGLTRLGVKSAFLGKLGDDPFGHFLHETLLENKVDVKGLIFTEKYNTGLTFAWVEDKISGEPKYLFYRQLSADRFLEENEIDWNWFKSAQILQFGSLMLANSPSRETAYTALATARQNGQLVCYDVNMRLPAWADRNTARAGMLEVFPLCHIVKLNRHELAFLTGESDLIEGVNRLWRPEFCLFLVTLDKEGCYFRSNSGEAIVPSFNVKVVDSVGAGDGWLAGFLTKLLETGVSNFDFSDKILVAEACRFANAVGALTTTRAGAIPALPTRRQVARFILKES